MDLELCEVAGDHGSEYLSELGMVVAAESVNHKKPHSRMSLLHLTEENPTLRLEIMSKIFAESQMVPHRPEFLFLQYPKSELLFS